MTALKPIENRRVRAVASERYPLNKKCAHPECTADATDPHHAFPRSAIGGDSWFVEIVIAESEANDDEVSIVIPHVTGLCREHHDQVEIHDAWIILDEEGVWQWYVPDGDDWGHVGELNPQPGSAETKPKRKRFKGEARKARRTISIRVPNDAAEDGGAVWDTLVEEVKEKFKDELGWSGDVPPYFVVTAALARALQD